ncbi:MAG TPA: sigma-70 family RNA polymerase sigma factor [Candidatus Polarisedimenticolia bacterium]|nr:sigma-70 family RNA polymerase sigma factor [Candidatus Polarisedimenticolia bacterium]
MEFKRPSRHKASDDPLERLVERVASGEEAAMGALYDATSPSVFGLALKILRDRAAAEEATLDVYLQAWRQAGRFSSEKGSVMAWLLMLARSRAVDLLRTMTRQPTLVDAAEMADTLVADGPGPEGASLELEKTRRIQTALGSLPPEQRRAIEAVYFGGLSHTDAARALGQPLGTVKTRIRTGLTTLKRSLSTVGENL